MTSAHSMQTGLSRRFRLRALFACVVLPICACESRDRLHSPASLRSPYERHELWAIAPFANETGVSIVKPDRIADLFMEQAEQIDGVDVIPVNRVLVAMQRLQMRGVNTPGDAVSLMNVLDVDGLIVGTVTSYDPYSPPKLGAAIQLYRRESPHAVQLDPVEVTRSTTELPSPGAISSNQPIAQASGVFDGSNHQTLMQIEEYAAGRTEPSSAFGARIYLAKMELYTQFVAYRLLHDLLERERIRLTPVEGPATRVPVGNEPPTGSLQPTAH
jgi:hypothetical protein